MFCVGTCVNWDNIMMSYKDIHLLENVGNFILVLTT
jgi:hypothetical protein